LEKMAQGKKPHITEQPKFKEGAHRTGFDPSFPFDKQYIVTGEIV
jgi:hypothetical protein